MTTQTRTSLEGIMPFFIVGSLEDAVEFYVQHLGFTKEYSAPEPEPFFEIVRRDRVAIMLKEIGPDTPPQPNHTRHEWAPWDAYIYSPDADALFEELRDRKVAFSRPIADTEDGLRAFEVTDRDGYVLCFGRPK